MGSPFPLTEDLPLVILEEDFPLGISTRVSVIPCKALCQRRCVHSGAITIALAESTAILRMTRAKCSNGGVIHIDSSVPQSMLNASS